jgi:hypothetical protein
MKALVCASLLALAAAGCAPGAPETDSASAGASAVPAAGKAQAQREGRDSRPGSREREEGG